MDIESVLSGIYGNLKQQTIVHKEILEIAKNKKDAIVKNEIEKLTSFTKQEQQLVFNIIDLEEEREKNIKELAQIFNKNQEELTISEVIRISKEKVKNVSLLNDIEEIKEALGNIITELKSINELNNQLIKNSLEYIDFNLNLMLGSTVQGTYGDGGKEMDVVGPSRGFDKKY